MPKQQTVFIWLNLFYCFSHDAIIITTISDYVSKSILVVISPNTSILEIAQIVCREFWCPKEEMLMRDLQIVFVQERIGGEVVAPK